MNAFRIAVFKRLAGALTAILGLGLSLAAAAQSPPDQWTNAVYTGTASSCASCHGNPVSLSAADALARGLTRHVDVSLPWMANIADMKTRMAGVNPAMTNFNARPAADRQAVLDYLTQVRDAVVTTSVAAFPSTGVGVTSATVRQVQISNFRFEALSFTATLDNTSDFSVTDNCAAGPSVAAASTCTLSVSYHPTQGPQSPPRAANLAVKFTSGTAVVPPQRDIALSGSVDPPLFGFAAGTLSFTSRMNQDADTKIGVVTNVGDATLAVASIVAQGPAPAGASYQLLTSPPGACVPPQSLAKGAACDVWVRFRATAQGQTQATFRITHNASGSPRDVVLQGTGTQPLIAATSTSLGFGNVQVGVPKPLALTLTNTGNGLLTFSAEPTAPTALSGPAKDDYAVSGGCRISQPLAPGATCTLDVTLTPRALDLRPATLTVASDANNGALPVSLSGTGVALPEPAVTFPIQDFPDTVIGEAAAQTRQITVSNQRTRAVGYSVADTTDFKLGAGGESCATRVVPGGGSCTITLEFRPAAGAGEGRRLASLNFSFTGTGGDPAPSPVTGTVAGKALLQLGQSASTLDVAAVVGTPSTVSVLLTNRGATSLALNDLVFSGNASSDYSIDASSTCVKGTALTAGANCTLVIRFNPATAGPRDATLGIVHAAAGSPQSVSLRGTATPAPQGRIELSALSLAFADTQVSSSAAQSITLRNTGDLVLTFSAFTASGAAPSDFERTGTCATASPLATGEQCTLVFTFRPSALGARSAALTILSDASNGSATIGLTGTGVPVPAPLAALAPNPLDFGTQTVGGLYPARSVRLTNVGTADLVTAAIAVDGAAFANTSTAACPAALSAGASCDVQISFTATAANANFTGNLRITTNAVGSPHRVSLLGSGSAAVVPVLVWSPAATVLDFGQVSAGAVSATQSVNLLNQGPGGVSLTVLNAVGADSAAFAVSGGTCEVGRPLFEAESCRVDVRFAPGSAGPKSASLQVASTGNFPPALALSGIGMAGPSPSLALSVTALKFDAVRVGSQSAPLELTLSSSGSGAVRVTGMAVSGPYATQGKSCPGLPFTLQAGAECTMSVMFQPQAEGTAAGVLRVETDADPSVREVTLSGTAEPKADLASGGCSVATRHSVLDPTLWVLALSAVAALWYRHRERVARRRARQLRRELP